MKKIILSAGGTGGHLFPAQSLTETLPTDWEVLFVAGGLKTNPYFDKHAIAYQEISCSTFSLKKPLQVIHGLRRIVRGIKESRALLRRYKPDLAVGFGSFFTLPLLTAAYLEKIPFLLHEQNAIPGKVNRLFSRFARATTYSFSGTDGYLKGSTIQVQFPLRKPSDESREECARYFGLQPHLPTLLIFGGSQGALRLNQLVLAAAPHLKEFQILHFTGNEERTLAAQKCYEKEGISACVKPFEQHMTRALKLATLAVTRAGASTIAELIAYELPALLIPFPFAAENHQEKNAEYFVFKVKGGRMYKEQELSSEHLIGQIDELKSSLPVLKKQIAEYKKLNNLCSLKDVIEQVIADAKP